LNYARFYTGAWGRGLQVVALWLVMLLCNPVLGQGPTRDSTTATGTLATNDSTTTDTLSANQPNTSLYGTAPVVQVPNVRLPSDTALNRYRTDPDYQYDQAPENEQTLWDRFLDWLSGLLPEPDPVDLPDAPPTVTEARKPANFSWILYVVVGIVIALLVLMLFNMRRMFRSKGAKALQFSQETEDIHTMDFPTLLQQALAVPDYRKAIRLRFLEALKSLEDAGAIRWRPEKTNRDYAFELSHPDARTWYREAMLVFDYTWYGHYTAEFKHFERLDYLAKRIESATSNRQRTPAVEPVSHLQAP
jgi:Domain of unknown function (DUF4129)